MVSLALAVLKPALALTVTAPVAAVGGMAQLALKRPRESVVNVAMRLPATVRAPLARLGKLMPAIAIVCPAAVGDGVALMAGPVAAAAVITPKRLTSAAASRATPTMA